MNNMMTMNIESFFCFFAVDLEPFLAHTKGSLKKQPFPQLRRCSEEKLPSLMLSSDVPSDFARASKLASTSENYRGQKKARMIFVRLIYSETTQYLRRLFPFPCVLVFWRGQWLTQL